MVSPPTANSRELTLRAVLIGLSLSMVMGAANVYLGLRIGMTVSASIPAAVLGSLILRAFVRGRGDSSTRLEANQIQTAASAGESLAAGTIFTMPALLLIGYWTEFDFVTTTLVAMTGGLLGILFMIPMRRVFVVEASELPYPEGVACAAVLESAAGAAADSTRETGASRILWGGALGTGVKALSSGFAVIQGGLEHAWTAGAGRVLYLGAEVSPVLVAVGFIVRLNVAFLVALGGIIGWVLCIPLLPEIRSLLAWLPGLESLIAATPAAPEGMAPEQLATMYWSTQVRYIGVGAMAVGGIASLFRVRAGIASAIRELVGGAADGGASAAPDLPAAVSLGLGAVAILGVSVLYYQFTSSLPITLITTALMIVLSFFFVAVASYIVGLVGNSNSPVSGMTITAVLLTALLLFQFGYSGMQGMVATLGVAAIVCCAACTSGDVCNDLKTGALVGASPRNQQIMQILGVFVASFVMAPVLQALQTAYGIGSVDLPAPQSGLFANLVQGFFGDGALPWDMVAFGVLIGLATLGIDALLLRAGSSFRAHLMPIAVGIYLPIGLSLPLLAGGMLSYLCSRGLPEVEREPRLRPGVLFSSGVIAGEALTGVGIALLLSSGYEVIERTYAAKPLVTLGVAAAVLGIFAMALRSRR